MTKQPNETHFMRTDQKKNPENKLEKGLITIACLGFFPLVYWVGKTIVELLK